MEDVHIYIDRPPGKEGTALEDLGEALRALDHVSDVDAAPGNVVAVSCDGGKTEREAIKRTVEEAGYGVTRLSVRSDFEEGPERGLWDIRSPETITATHCTGISFGVSRSCPD